MRLLWFALLLVLNFVILSNGDGNKASSRPDVVNIGALFTFNSTIGRVAKIAIEAAIEDVNADSSVLGGTRLAITMQDTKCSGFIGIAKGALLIFTSEVYRITSSNA